MLEPRIFELIATLDSAGLDWLSRDVIAGIFAGNVEQEPQEALIAIRLAINHGRAESPYFPNPDSRAATPSDMSGEEQVNFAVNLVSQRLREIVIMISKSIHRLDRIVDGPDAGVTRRGSAVRLVAAEKDVDSIADIESVSAALEVIGDVEAALDTWRTGLSQDHKL